MKGFSCSKSVFDRIQSPRWTLYCVTSVPKDTTSLQKPAAPAQHLPPKLMWHSSSCLMRRNCHSWSWPRNNLWLHSISSNLQLALRSGQHKRILLEIQRDKTHTFAKQHTKFPINIVKGDVWSNNETLGEMPPLAGGEGFPDLLSRWFQAHRHGISQSTRSKWYTLAPRERSKVRQIHRVEEECNVCHISPNSNHEGG